MKRSRTFIFLMAMTTLWMATQASEITPTQAQAVAQAFLHSSSTRRAAMPAIVNSELTLAYEATTNAVADFYVFNVPQNNGYVIVAADDRATPVLAYSDAGAFDCDDMPDNMRWWLGEYQREMQYIKSHPALMRRSTSKLSRSVAPLLTCLWNQRDPYNLQCPTYTLDGEKKQAVTGCVATAMAQIMYYHKWPKRGQGSHSYTYNVGGAGNQTLSADFSESVYDWDIMLDAYDKNSSVESQNAVAKLMSDVGISVEMMYKNGSSGATSVSVPIALKEYFNYSENTRILYRQFFGIDYWENMLRTELDAGRPIYYSGSASGGGHAFVFDGYDTDGFFHINWGWGGRSNGYFVVTMLNPLDQGIGSFSGGYNSTQQAVVGIRPEDGELEAYSFDAFYAIFSPSATSVALGETAQFAGKPAMLGATSWKQLRWGVVILNADETQVVLGPEYFDASECKVGYYYNATFEIDLPADLPEGQYHAKLVYTVDDEPYHFFGNAPDVHAFVLMEVRDGVAYFSVSDESQLSLVSLEPNSTTLYAGQSVQIAAIVHNAGVEYYGNLSLVFLKNGVVGNSENIGVDIAQGSDYSFTTRLSVPTATGTYALALRDDDAQQIGSAVTVTVLPSTDCALSIASPLVAASEMPANDIQASVNLMNTGGAFMGVIEMMVLPADTLLINSIIESEVVTIPQNEKVTVNFKGSFGGLISKGYRLWLRNPNPDKTNAYYLWDKPASFIVSKPATSLRDGDVNGDGEVDVSDANVVLNIVLGKASSGDYPGVADVSGDGVIDVADVNKLINLILNKR